MYQVSTTIFVTLHLRMQAYIFSHNVKVKTCEKASHTKISSIRIILIGSQQKVKTNRAEPFSVLLKPNKLENVIRISPNNEFDKFKQTQWNFSEYKDIYKFSITKKGNGCGKYQGGYNWVRYYKYM